MHSRAAPPDAWSALRLIKAMWSCSIYCNTHRLGTLFDNECLNSGRQVSSSLVAAALAQGHYQRGDKEGT